MKKVLTSVTHNILMLRILGYWNKPLQNFTICKGIYIFYGFVINFIYCCSAISQYINLYFNLNNFEAVITNLSMSIITTLGLIKLFMLQRHKKTYVDLLNQIVSKETNDQTKDKDVVLRSIISKKIKRARKIVFLYLGYILFSCIGIGSAPLIEFILFPKKYEDRSIERPMIYKSWLPLNQIDHYLIYYLFQVIVFVVDAYVHVTWDSLSVSLIIHALGQIEILKHKIVNMLLISDKMEIEVKADIDESDHGKKEMSKEIIDNIIYCINFHYYLLRYIKNLNKITSKIFLYMYLILTLIFCFLGFYIVTENPTVSKIKPLFTIGAVFSQSCLYFSIGDELIEKSAELFSATYECDWVNQDASFRKLLLNFRNGLRIPLQVKMGKYFILSWPTLVAILKMSYSMIAVLKKIKDRTN